MRLYKIKNLKEYRSFLMKTQEQRAEHQKYLEKSTLANNQSFCVPGYSYTAKKKVYFTVNSTDSGSERLVNWRESVSCPETYFNNRMRATFHLFDLFMNPYPNKDIYISEQLTPIYDYFKKRFVKTIGSEFIGDSIPLGSVNENNIRNEDMRNLSFEDNKFDAIVSLDVFEHVPLYKQAFRECVRVLKPGGSMMWSVPFLAFRDKTLIRSKIINGEITHFYPPEYHGDPLSSDGVLCFQYFGWDMMEDMKRAGFSDAYAINYQSVEFGYLGHNQFMFFATK